MTWNQAISSLKTVHGTVGRGNTQTVQDQNILSALPQAKQGQDIIYKLGITKVLMKCIITRVLMKCESYEI